MKATIVGGAGRMGAWFARYFSSRGFPTAITDVRGEEAREVASAVGAELKGTNIGAAGDADLVLISVPIPSVGKVVSEVAPHMREGAVLAEVSSVKETTVRALREAAAFGVKPLSIHPLFGPAAESLKGKTIVVVPVIDGDAEAGLAERLFEGAEIVVSEQEEHDRAMAVVLGLTHFMNLAFARVLSEADIASLKRLAGTTFTVQLAVAEAVVSEEPGLVASLLRENRHTSEYLDRFTAAAEMLRNLMTEGPEAFEGLYESLRASLGEDPDYHKADERRYRAFEALMD